MRVGSHDGIGVNPSVRAVVAGHGQRGQVFQVHLVDDAGIRRDHAEIFKCGLPPAQKLVALTVAFEFQFRVRSECISRSESIDHDRVVNDEFGWRERIDLVRIATQFFHGAAHGCQIANRGHAGEILHQHASRHELNFSVGLCFGFPLGQSFDVAFANCAVVLVAEQVLEQNFQRERKFLEVADPLRFEGLERVVVEGFSAYLKVFFGAKAIQIFGWIRHG